MEVSAAFGVVIRRLRIAKGLTQEQLGFEAGLRRTFVSSLELGQKEPSLTTIFKLSSALKFDVAELLRLVEKELAQ
ncbi:MULTISPECIES: helix-turn-helix domain-containing protein [unclassified Polynucleobacter]|jgi:transcriptional regulator with XRE-family HTH domain|uniref:helix-turn-helix domain-containing protein n=1 Tax=unclassified Polynucleobacter TaxID=2640945 RepID=UPI001C0E04BE|nr:MULTISPECIES: helix-turn-helix transcriptional regulator [unclassified Polynucleobacter]MBU3562365.1 helix-turn-helix transcriptional regulator [Polynucleobacter sp. Tro8-14-1]MEA9568398.1 helix-turn-helix transcriptional regulator [Polynucleobacter sp. AP-Nickl1-40-C4]